MDLLELIKRRRSVRSYLPEQIKEAELGAILEAGMYAPSGHNCQPWHFLVIQDQTVLQEINRRTKEIMERSQQEKFSRRAADDKFSMFYHAPTVVIVSASKEAESPMPLAATGASYTPLVDCGAAIQNMLLMAESLGIGSCWIGNINFLLAESDYVSHLGVPDGYQPYFAVTLGYKQPLAAEAKAPVRTVSPVVYVR